MVLCAGILLLWALASIAQMFANTLSYSGGADFHSYWYAGHFIRQGTNPYRAYFTGESPSLPVTYLDGEVTRSLPIGQTNLNIVPANTAPFVLVLSIFSFFSWPLAKILWMICNLIFMFLIPWLVVRLFPADKPFSFQAVLLLHLVFYGLSGTRHTVGMGQTSLIILASMLGALITRHDNRLVSGILLGFALSKYSLALPVFLFFVYKRAWRVLAISATVQIAGLWAIAQISGDSPVLLVQQYTSMLLQHIDDTGINLSNLIPGNSLLAIVIVSFGTLVVAGLLANWIRQSSGPPDRPGHALNDFHILTILVLWGLLVAYHQLWDTVAVIFCIALIMHGLDQHLWSLSDRQRLFVTTALAIFVVVASFSAKLITPFSDKPVMFWVIRIDASVTVALVFMLAMTMWLLYRTRYAEKSAAYEQV